MNRFDSQATQYKAVAGRGALYMGLGQGLRVICQILSVIILSRLLSPSDFGLYAMAWPVIGLIGLFQTMGLSQAIIQKPVLQEAEVSALFWINLLVNIVLVLILVMTAPLAGWFYKEPEIVPLVWALSAAFLVQGLGTQPEALLNRKMDFATIALVGASAGVVTLSVSIAVSLFHPSYWALFWGTLSGCIWANGWYWMRARWWPGRPQKSKEVMDMVKFGAGITGFNLTSFVERNIDDILIGRVWGSAPLGLYDRAYKLLLFPLQQVIAPIGKVMVPVLSRLIDEPERYRRAYFRVINQILVLIFPGAVFLLVMADVFIPFVLGENWAGVVPVFQALAFVGLLQPISNPNGWLYVSQGRGHDLVVAGIFSACFTAALIIAGLPYGITGVAVTYAAGQYIKHPIIWWLVGRAGPVKFRDFLSLSGFYIFIALVTACLLCLAKGQLAALPDLWHLIAMAALSYSVFLGLVLMFARGRKTLSDTLEMICSYTGKRS